MLDTLYPLKMTSLPGYWDSDRDRPRTRNTRSSNAQCTNIFISKSLTFRLRTTIVLLASLVLAPNRGYTMRVMRHFDRKHQWRRYANGQTVKQNASIEMSAGQYNKPHKHLPLAWCCASAACDCRAVSD